MIKLNSTRGRQEWFNHMVECLCLAIIDVYKCKDLWTGCLFFFQNEEIFVQLDELDELDRITMNRIQLQPYTSTENILVYG